jgi:hypothetical protein
MVTPQLPVFKVHVETRRGMKFTASGGDKPVLSALRMTLGTVVIVTAILACLGATRCDRRKSTSELSWLWGSLERRSPPVVKQEGVLGR